MAESMEVKPIGVGEFGEIYDQFKGDVQGAIAFLLNKKSGEAIGALYHKEIGDIDLVWGENKSTNPVRKRKVSCNCKTYMERYRENLVAYSF